MNAHDDQRIDAALEALARQEPPADHVARVLARSGPQTSDGPGAMGYLRPRWILPVAATVVAAMGMTWQLNRRIEQQVDAVTAGWDQPSPVGFGGPGSRPYLGEGSRWGAPEEVVRPVLPPQAYWGLDPFEEWRSLRPGTGHGAPGTGTAPGTGHRAPGTGQRAVVLAWVPVPSGLPPLELESIAPAPLVVAPLAPLEDIALAEIAVEPIVIAPLIEEERP